MIVPVEKHKAVIVPVEKHTAAIVPVEKHVPDEAPVSQDIVTSQEIEDDDDRTTEYSDNAIVQDKANVPVTPKILDAKELQKLAKDATSAPTPKEYTQTKKDEKEEKVIKRLRIKTQQALGVPDQAPRPRGRPKKNQPPQKRKSLKANSQSRTRSPARSPSRSPALMPPIISIRSCSWKYMTDFFMPRLFEHSFNLFVFIYIYQYIYIYIDIEHCLYSGGYVLYLQISTFV